jgi:hypothetical protein
MVISQSAMHCAALFASFQSRKNERGLTACEVQLAGHRGDFAQVLRECSLTLALLVLGCSSRLPAPEHVRHAREAFVPVPYPPPAALAETVPRRPESGDPVWVDGEWAFHGRMYVWQRGGWVRPPPGARFAPWRALYRRNGRLLLAPGTWYDGSGNALPRPEVIAPATTPPNEITTETQSGR